MTNVTRISQLRNSIRGVDTEEAQGSSGYVPQPPPQARFITWVRGTRTFTRGNRAIGRNIVQ